MKNKKLIYSVIGALLASGAPLGWLLLSSSFTDAHRYIYVYLWTSTTIVFVAFGWHAGTLMERLSKLADTDRLTGLLNQAAFKNVASKLHSYCQRENLDQSVVMLDIDHFKKVNDNADHQFGSYIIQEVGYILSALCRHSDVVARFGGDEFVIFLPSTSGQHAAILCERIQSRIKERVFKRGSYQTMITLSLGIASSNAVTIEELISRADEALYKSKANGRNCYTVFSDDVRDRKEGSAK